MLSCNVCLKEKPNEEFYKRPSRPRGYQYSCIECQHKVRNRNKDKRRTYYREYYRGWNASSRKKLLKSIGGDEIQNCMICGKEFENAKEKHVDHSHATGKIRGILCRSCNCGLGNFRDSIDLLKSAAKYLKSR